MTHYGWEATDKPDRVTMVWPRATGDRNSPWMLLDMCFTYGMKAEIDRGKGRMVALRVSEREDGE